MNTLKNHLIIVIGLEHYNALGILRTMGEKGIDPVFIAIKHRVRVASASRYISELHLVETEEEAFDVLMKNYGDICKNTGYKPILLFGDDKTVEFYDRIYEEIQEKFILYNAHGKNNGITKYIDKKEILECAKRHGVPVLPTCVTELGVIPKDLEYPVITKAISPNAGAWKGDVHVCKNEQELREAMKIIKSPQVLLQKYIVKKTEITFEGFTINDGKDIFISIECSYPYTLKSYYSPLHDVKPNNHPKLMKKINEMMKEIGFNGIFDVEFLVDQEDYLWILEINFRNTGWSYASTVSGNPLPYLWCEAVLSGKLSTPKNFEPFLAMVEPFDYVVRVEEKGVPLPEWLYDFKRAKCTYYYDVNDIEPWKVLCRNWDELK